MSHMKSTQSSETKPSLERSGIMRIVQVLVSVLIIGVLLFFSAGRLDWVWAWLFLAGWLIFISWSADESDQADKQVGWVEASPQPNLLMLASAVVMRKSPLGYPSHCSSARGGRSFPAA